MRNANLLSPAYIGKTAADLKLDTQVFSACASSSKFDEAIEADMVEAAGLGLTGTPTFIVGRTTPGVLEGSVVVGALPVREVRREAQRAARRQHEVGASGFRDFRDQT